VSNAFGDYYISVSHWVCWLELFDAFRCGNVFIQRSMKHFMCTWWSFS